MDDSIYFAIECLVKGYNSSVYNFIGNQNVKTLSKENHNYKTALFL